MHWIDWSIIGLLLLLMVVIAFGTHKLTRSVADFLAANRSCGRYLLTMASGMSGLGAITIAANFEKFYEAGFPAIWWGTLMAPLGLVLALSGFVIYRYRETRAMTMAQFFEMRYSRRFRVFAGFLACFSGILNYGIFPAVTARFLIYFTGLPTEFTLLGMELPTMAPVMLFMLSLALILTLSGGQIAVVVTDFCQGLFVQIALLVIFFVVASQISWSDLITGLQTAAPDQSRINPFKQEKTEGFNMWFFFISAALSIYSFKAWQGSQGYNASAKSPHEAKMAGILGEFRGQVLFLLSTLVPLYIFAMLALPEFAPQAAVVNETIATIGSEQIQKQMLVPVGISQLLPVGVMGMFAAVVIAAAVSTDDTYLHSWGSIFIQDVVMPLRKKPLSKRAHMLLLRGAIFGVAAFAFFFSLLFPLNEYIYMYFQITGAIFLGGAGSVILGGLYWKRGSVEGAWASMIIGSSLAVTAVVLRNIIWPHFLEGWKLAYPNLIWLQELPEKFPFNGMQMSLIVAIAGSSSYILFSLLSKRPPVDMDKLLHRGKYSVEAVGHHPMSKPGDLIPSVSEPVELRLRDKIWRRLGVNDDFTRGDKAIYIFKIAWVMFFFTVFLVGSLIAMFVDIPDSIWITWWGIKVSITIVVGLAFTVWFLIGGVHDLIDMIRTLKNVDRDANDDGHVAGEDHLQE
ncbi:hypothetical protein QEH59_00080 [Coraliomargarita sp. SDUM461004]|uniref:Sodium:solute symporter n=2 Tax=Thalassobacterium sedimentorum TaxID=3041258 RepID=A0ABU1AE96_9BACT|nr:hypothetical protein [Coraliomargarita sp. SDUM461004]